MYVAGSIIKYYSCTLARGLRLWRSQPVAAAVTVCVYGAGRMLLYSEVYTPWAIKKRAPFIFLITLANIHGFS